MCENEFLNDKENFVALSIGIKGSGKTTILLSYLIHAINNNLYDEYYLILPQYINAKTITGNSQYQFLNGLKNVYIVKSYNEVVSKKVLKSCDGKKKIFYGIDDATAYGIDIKHDTSLLNLIVTARHVKCSVWLLVHACRSVLSIPIRANVDYMFLHRIQNSQIVDTLFYEYFSLQNFDKKTFYEYIKNVFDHKYNALFLSARTGNYDNNVCSWNLSQRRNYTINKIVNKKIEKKISKYQPKKGFSVGMFFKK